MTHLTQLNHERNRQFWEANMHTAEVATELCERRLGELATERFGQMRLFEQEPIKSNVVSMMLNRSHDNDAA